jgi:hypothetical protein
MTSPHKGHVGGPEQGDKCKAKDNGWEGIGGIENQKKQIVEQPRTIARNKPQHHAKAHRNRNRKHADLKRIGRPGDHPREHIAAQLVGAEQMLGRGRQKSVRHRNLERIIGGQRRTEEATENDEHNKDQSQKPQGVRARKVYEISKVYHEHGDPAKRPGGRRSGWR